MNYLVTGGSGFIGSHLVGQLLKSGHSVISIDNFDSFYDYSIKIKNTLESVGKPFEFRFSEREKDIQKLILETSTESFTLYYQDIRDIEGLRKIFSQELCRDFGIKKFVCASSSSVYGNNEKVPFSETDDVDAPISPYAATKRCNEIMGHVYYHLYQIDMVQLRFFTVYGPGQRPDLAIHKFTRMISGHQEIPFYGDGSTARDYTYIDDIVEGIVRLIGCPPKGDNTPHQVFNIGNNNFQPW